MDSGAGWHQCMPANNSKTWCGSNYDSKGNPRFKDTNHKECTAQMVTTGSGTDLEVTKADPANTCIPYGYGRMEYGIFEGDFSFGYTNFDNFASAFVTVFQSVTEEGWVDIMYPLMDSYNPVVTALVFIAMNILGSLFMMNLFLAEIMESLEDAKEDEAEAEGITSDTTETNPTLIMWARALMVANPACPPSSPCRS